MTCVVCKTERETKLTPTGRERLPTGWKRTVAGLFCRACWRERRVLRAIAMPVASPLDGDWKQLRAALKPMFALTTQASNWMMRELYIRDVRRDGQVKLPPMETVYLYPEARELFPGLPSQTVAALEQATKKRYRKLRWDVIWRSAISLSIYRYPVPFPQPNQAWHVTIEEDQPIVSLRIGEERWRLRLKAGPQFHRQFKGFKQIAGGEAEKGEAVIYEKGSALMLKLVAWFKRPEPQPKPVASSLAVRTASDALLIAVNGKDERVWTYHGRHIRRWSAEHAERLQEWADDSKMEARPVPSFSERREAACAKHRDRIRSAAQEAASYVAGYARRRRFGAVSYDDRERNFCPGFAWAALRERLRTKLDECGIKFQPVASGQVEPESKEPLAKEPSL